MNKIFHKSLRVVLVAILMVVFAPPLNNALAQEELPNDEFVSTTGETTSAEEDTAQDTGESAPAEEETVQDTYESNPAEDTSVQETDESSPVEEDTVQETDESSPVEEDTVQETGEADPADEDPVQAQGEPPAAEGAVQTQESAHAAEDAASAEEEFPPEEEADNAVNEAAPPAEESILLSEEIIDMVRQMAEVNAMLLDEQNQPISLATEEAVETLKQNAAQISNAILSSSSSSTVIISQENADHINSGLNGVGQSFTSTANGSLTMLEFAANTTGPFTLTIYMGEPGSSTVLHSQPISLIDTVNSTGGIVDSFTFQSATLSTPVALSQGQLYSFGITGFMPSFAVDVIGSGSYYTGGDLYTSDGSWIANLNRDLAFRVYITMNQTVIPEDNKTYNNTQNNIGVEKEEKPLRAQFVRGQDDYGLVPSELRIQGILSYTFEDGYIVFNLPDNVPSEDVAILFWNGSSWSYLTCILVIDNQIQGPAAGSGTYVMVVNQ